MSPGQILLDSTAEISPIQLPRTERLKSLQGLTIGLLDICKPRGDEFLDRPENLLRGEGLNVKRYLKERFSKLAAPELRAQISDECDLAVEALAD